MLSCIIVFLASGVGSTVVRETDEGNIPSSELNALHDFYNATNGLQWDWMDHDDDYYVTTGNPWNFSAPDPNPCNDDWIGITCTPDPIDGYLHVLEIELSDTNLIGTIPGSISELTYLSTLNLELNHLYSSIPPSLYTMSNLTYINLDSSRLTGTLPWNIDSLTQIQHFAMSYNDMHGSIPDTLYNLTNLNYLVLDLNGFTGTISPLVSKLTKLEHLSVMYCQLHGQLPSEVLCTPSLTEVLLPYNYFSGTLPECGVVLPNLTSLVFTGNQIYGTIPESYGLYSSMWVLYFTTNQLTGTIPDALGSMTELQLLELNENDLTGTIPESLARLNISAFNLLRNHLTGTIPEVLWSNEKLQGVELGHNLISGTLSNSIGNPANPYYLKSRVITGLQVDSNLLTGTLPKSLSQLRLMQAMFVNNNFFTGTLDGVFNATTMLLLLNVDVSTNQLTGTIPEEVFRVRHLLSFAASSNCFHGSLPDNICGAHQLKTLSLDGLMSADSCHNRFFPHWTHIDSYWTSREIEGSIPTCLLDSMPYLNILHLSGNGFKGSIPNLDYISVNLTGMSLSNNLLKGKIPDSIQVKVWESSLDLSYNQLGGVLSSRFPSYSINSSLTLDVNRLSGAIPSSLKDTKHISILDSNLFSCSASRSSLPTHDPNKEQYECGSNSLNVVLYIWLAFGVVLSIAVVTVWSCAHNYFRSTKTLLVQYISACSGGGLTDFSSFVCHLRSCCNLLAAVIFVVMMTVNTALSSHFNTYSHEYAWNISSVFMSGVVPAVVLLIVVGGLSMMEWRAFVKYLKKSQTSEECKGLSVESGLPTKSWTFLQKGVLLCTVLGNVVLMIAVNIGYVYVNTNYSNTAVQLTQIAVAVFKVCWNGFILRFVLRLTRKFNEVSSDSEVTHGSLNTAMSIMLFNNLAAPFLAIALISSSCFYDVITTPPAVETSYSYYSCNGYQYNSDDDHDDFCTEYIIASDIRSTSYIPPFHYGYQCSSTYISVYSSIYVIMLIISTFITPLLQIAAVALEKQTRSNSLLSRALNGALPRTLRANHSVPRVSMVGAFLAGDSVFDCEMFIVQLINIVAVMLTFGVVLPPIALFCCAAVLSMTWFAQLCIGRFVMCSAEEIHFNEKLLDHSPTQALGNETSQARSLFLRSLWIVVPYCVVFFSFLLFDTLGDAEGWKVAIAIPIVVFGVIGMCAVSAVWCLPSRRSNSEAHFGESHSRGVSDDISSGVRLTAEYDN